jgi:Putative beta-barrel porin 2
MRRVSRRWRIGVAAGVAAAWLMLAPTSARAQGSAGGPGAPLDADPTQFAFRLGPVLLTPGLQVDELGVDNNVFRESVDPKQDWVVAASPDLNVYVRMRFIRFTMFTAANFRYYFEYESERSVGQQLRGRLDFLLSRLKPYVSASRTNSFDRPNKEIDARAEHLMPQLAGGFYFEWSPTTNFYVDVTRDEMQYRSGETFDGVNLDEALDSRTYRYSGGLVTSVTPLTTISVSGNYEETEFRYDPLRNTTSRGGQVGFTFGPEAVMRGSLTLGYRDFRPVDPTVEPYQGITANGNISIPVRDLGTLALMVFRDTQYSFDEAQAYYVDTTGQLTYTQRVFGPFDLQVQGSYGELDYGRTADQAPKTERLYTYGGGVGYNLQDRSRFGLNIEWLERETSLPSDTDRNYTNRRLFGSWTYRF